MIRRGRSVPPEPPGGSVSTFLASGTLASKGVMRWRAETPCTASPSPPRSTPRTPRPGAPAAAQSGSAWIQPASASRSKARARGSKNSLSTMPWRSGKVPVGLRHVVRNVLEGYTGTDARRAPPRAACAPARGSFRARADRAAPLPRAGSRGAPARAASAASSAASACRARASNARPRRRQQIASAEGPSSISPASARRPKLSQRQQLELHLLGRLAPHLSVGGEARGEENGVALVADAGAA